MFSKSMQTGRTNAQVSAREQLNSSVSFRSSVGTWLEAQKAAFNYKQQNGKVLRYRFNPFSTGTTTTTSVHSATPPVLMGIFNQESANGGQTALAVRDGRGRFTLLGKVGRSVSSNAARDRTDQH